VFQINRNLKAKRRDWCTLPGQCGLLLSTPRAFSVTLLLLGAGAWLTCVLNLRRVLLTVWVRT